MNESPYGRRKLPYPYSYLVSQTYGAPELETGRVFLPEFNQTNFNFYVIALTPDEQLRFSSALQAGADLIYPAEQVDVQAQWLYAREYPNDFTGGGLVSICNAIADCIETSPIVQQALAGQSGGEGGGAGASGGTAGGGASYTIPSNVDNTINMIEGALCTNDNLYAIAVGIVNTAFKVVVDAYEIIEFATNALELAAGLADNFPVWMSAGLGTAAEIGNWIQENAYDGFLAYDTLTTRIDIACDLYCIMQENGCELTYDDLALYFIYKSSVTIVGNSFDSLGDVVAALSTSDEIGTTSLALMFATLNIGGRFGGILGATSFFTIVNSSLDETDPGWVSCDPCAAWTHTINLEIENPSYLTIVRGNYVSGIGIQNGQDNDVFGVLVSITADSTTYQNITFEFNKTNGSFSTGPLNDFIFHTNGQPANRYDNRDSASNASPYSVTSVDDTQTTIGGAISCAHTDTANTGSLVLKRIVLAGTGTKPSQFV